MAMVAPAQIFKRGSSPLYMRTSDNCSKLKTQQTVVDLTCKKYYDFQSNLIKFACQDVTQPRAVLDVEKSKRFL